MRRRLAAAAAALAAIGTVMWRRNSKARRFGWSSLLGVLLCLITVAGGLVTAAGGAALAASSSKLPDVTAVLAACESALNNTVVQKGALRQQSCIGKWTRTLLKGAWIPMQAKNLRGVFHGCIATDGGFPLTCIHRQSALRSRSESVLVLQPLNGTRAVAVGGPSKNVSIGEDPRVFVHGLVTRVLDNTRNAMRLLRLDVRRSLVTLEADLPFAGKNLSPLTSYTMGEPLQLLDLQKRLLIKLELGGAAHIRQPTFDRVKLSYGNEHSQGPCECNGLDLRNASLRGGTPGQPICSGSTFLGFGHATSRGWRDRQLWHQPFLWILDARRLKVTVFPLCNAQMRLTDPSSLVILTKPERSALLITAESMLPWMRKHQQTLKIKNRIYRKDLTEFGF